MIRRRREWHPGKTAVPGRGEQAQRVPPTTPRIANARGALENDEVRVVRGEVVSDGEAGLATADDDGLEALDAPEPGS